MGNGNPGIKALKEIGSNDKSMKLVIPESGILSQTMNISTYHNKLSNEIILNNIY